MVEKDDLPAFVRAHLNSVWSLEILLIMRRQAPHRWSIEDLVKELRASPGLVASSLERLETSGLVIGDQTGHFEYSPAPGLIAICDNLDAAYRERPVAIINLISAPEDRLQKLADAFRFKGGDS
jgi:hypothetical protein